MAFTSDLNGAGSDEGHAVELKAIGETKTKLLYNLPGDDYLEEEGDFWKYKINSFGFSGSCIELEDITGIAIVESSDDAWNIDSIVTFFIDSQNGKHTGSIDLDAYRWVDGDGPSSRLRFDLTLV